MQPPPQSGYGTYAPNGPMQPQGGPQKPFPQSYQAGDPLTAQMGNMQISGQGYPQSNGQPAYPPSNQQQFRPQPTNTPLGHGSLNGMNGPPSHMSRPPQSGLPPHGSPQMGPPQTHPQAGLPPMSPPQMSGPPQGVGGPPPQQQSQLMGPPQFGGAPSGPPHQGASPPGQSQQLRGPSAGHPSMGGPPMVAPPMGTAPGQFHPQGHAQGPASHNAYGPSNSNAGPPPMGAPPGQSPPQGPLQGPPPSQNPYGTSHKNAQSPPMGAPPGQLPPQGLAHGPPSSQNFYGSSNHNAGPPQRPAGFAQNGPPLNSMTGPPSGAQNGLQSAPTSAFQPPPQAPFGPPGGPPSGPPTGPTQGGYNMGSPMSPPGQYNPPPPPMGQGYAQSPPNMYNQQNGQYPPMPQPQEPIHNQAPGGYPQQPQAPPQRKLDPDHMPSPIQVIEDDRKNSGELFTTSRLGSIPPLVTTDVDIQDEGNSGPNYIRSTVYSVPCSPDVIKQTQVPLAVAITPFAKRARVDGVLPCSVFNEEIVRCNRCKAYMCPFMQFMDGGRRFQCVFCKATTEVPQNYFNHLDHNGARVDKWQRAELCLGSYEILATQEYCKNNTFPKAPPAFIFVLDVSYNAIKNGMVKLFCDNILEILQDLPTEDDEQNAPSDVRVGFITYSSQVHFYNIDPTLSNPQMMVVPDVVDMFVPFLEGCLVKVSEATNVIKSLCEEIPKMFADTRETETILGPAIQAGMEALKATECPGKLFVFHTTMPTVEAPGKLKNRDDRKLLGTEKEKTVLAPACPYYLELATQCVQAGCSVDLFIANNSFVDVASIGQVAKVSGGDIYKYTYFQAETDGERFLSDLRRDVARPIAFDAVLRVRTSTGLRPTDFYGNFYMQNTTDVELASIDCDKCITVEMKYDDKLPEGECAFIQVALLYTSVKGIRKLRLHNLCLQTTTQMADMFRNCELDTILNLFCKQGLRQLMDGNPKSLRESLTLRASTILANYRKHCATASSHGQLILPECMKLMPLYVCCMMKCDALAGGPELTVDDRAYAMLCLGSMDVKSSQIYLYPRLLAIHNLDPSDDSIPTATRTTVEKIRENEAYILENGFLMFLYVGLQIDPSWCESVFGVSNPVQIDLERKLPVLNNPLSKRIHELIATIRNERHRFMKLYIVRQGDKLERVLRQFLVEDRMSDVQPSYVDYLCQLHREIRGLI